ncbi:MAG: hypothetical protein ACKVLL_00915 [Verrucomicrobiales bacterium]
MAIAVGVIDLGDEAVERGSGGAGLAMAVVDDADVAISGSFFRKISGEFSDVSMLTTRRQKGGKEE